MTSGPTGTNSNTQGQVTSTQQTSSSSTQTAQTATTTTTQQNQPPTSTQTTVKPVPTATTISPIPTPTVPVTAPTVPVTTAVSTPEKCLDNAYWNGNECVCEVGYVYANGKCQIPNIALSVPVIVIYPNRKGCNKTPQPQPMQLQEDQL